MVDFVYDSYFLSKKVVPALRTMPKLFLGMFGEVIQSDKEYILFDTEKTTRPRITPFVHPMAKGRVIEGVGYRTNMVKPSYLKDLRAHYPHQQLKRRAGEPLGAPLSAQQRLLAAVASDLQDQRNMFQNRLEVMAAEAVIHGRQTIKGEGFGDGVVVEFGRSNASKTVLAGTSQWDDPACTIDHIFGQLEDEAEAFRDRNGYAPTTIIMDPKAWALLRAKLTEDAGKKYLDKSIKGYERVNIDLTPSMASDMGLQAKGTFGDLAIFTFQSEYQDPEDAAGSPMRKEMPDNTVLMLNPGMLEGVRHFGAIQSIDSNDSMVLEPMEFFASSWVERNPAQRMLQLESAPLLVPYRPNAVQTITVA